MVRGTVEEALNAMLDAEADCLCGAARYERSEARQDTRAGAPQSLDPFAVHAPTLDLQKPGDLAVTVPAIPLGQPDQSQT